MKLTKTLLVIILLIVTVFLPNEIALAQNIRHIPKTNASGDYIFTSDFVPQAYVDYDWIVTDKDPSGLNCRMLKKYWGISMDAMNVPDILYQNNTHNIANWSVMTTFKTGTRLRPETTQFGGNIFLKDKQGKVWVPVDKEPIGRNTFDGSGCFVRANKRFIKPVLRTD
jgi:hypothetical protein